MRYVGQTGTTLHLRQKTHKSDKESALTKHTSQEHQGDNKPPASFRMKPLKGSLKVLDRLITEGVMIDQEERITRGSLMNSRGEAGRGKMVRYVPEVRRI